MKVFTVICVRAWGTNTHTRVNLYEMSTYKPCWSWSVSQFSTCMTLLRHLKFPDWQSNVDFPWPNELTICPDINGSKISLNTSCTGHRWHKAKDFFVSCSGEICLVLFQGCSSLVSITTILATHLLHEFIANVKHRMDWSYRKRTLYLLVDQFLEISCWWKMFNFGEYAEICHLPLTSLKDCSFPWLILKFPDLINCSLRVK